MEELIERLKVLVNREMEAVGPDMWTRGMHDILLAMKDRIETIKIRNGQTYRDYDLLKLLERA